MTKLCEVVYRKTSKNNNEVTVAKMPKGYQVTLQGSIEIGVYKRLNNAIKRADQIALYA